MTEFLPDDLWAAEQRAIEERRIEKTGHIEFRYYGPELDEFIATNATVHFECMGTGAWWMLIETPDGRQFHVNLGVKKAKAAGESAELRWRDKHLTNWAFHEEDQWLGAAQDAENPLPTPDLPNRAEHRSHEQLEASPHHP